MTNIYYTAKTGKRNANGHTITRGEVYAIVMGEHESLELESIGTFRHQSGAEDLDFVIRGMCRASGLDPKCIKLHQL